MSTRIGKIARLPRQVREDLNCRIDDGEPATTLVAWLNSLPELQQERTEAKQRFWAPLLSRLPQAFLAKVFGDGEDAMKIAGFILEVQNDLSLGSLSGDLPSRAAKAAKLDPNPSGDWSSKDAKTAGPIPSQANPTESN